MNAEVAGLIDKGRRALTAAEHLAASGDTEWAAGRAYYSMLHAAQALLRAEGREYRKHGSVHAAFGEHFAKTKALDPKFHRWLLDAYDQRVRGDYDINPAIDAATVKRMIDQAREFIEMAASRLAARD